MANFQRFLLFSVFVGVLLSSCLCEGHGKLRDEEQEEKNKALVLEFFNAHYVQKNVDQVDNYIDPEPSQFINHNPTLLDGREPFKELFRKIFAYGPFNAEVVRVAADGDLVWLHMKVEGKLLTDNWPGNPKTMAIVDIFRVKDGKIVELWDVTQPVPSEAVHDHPLF